MKSIFLWTVQHSGTWLLVNVIGKSSIERVSFVQVSDLEAMLKESFTHRHKLAQGHWVDEGLNGGNITLFHDHVAPDSISARRPKYQHARDDHCTTPERVQLAFAYALPTIVTMRDPLRSIITNRQRKPMIDERGVIINWMTLANALDALGKRVLVIPVDLWSSTKIIHETLTYLELDWGRRADDLAREWPTVNTGHIYEEKTLYDRGDALELKKRLGPVWDDLRTQESELRPMLERYGYRDLMWWS